MPPNNNYPTMFNNQVPAYHPPADPGYNAAMGVGPRFSIPEHNNAINGSVVHDEEDRKSAGSVDDFEARLNALKRL